MRKTLAIVAILLFAVAALAQAPANRNANGIGYFMLQVPNPASMVMDGKSNDWAWFDPTYTVTMDQFVSEQAAPMQDPSDFDITVMMGWSPVPDNKWYLFAAVHDDTLDIEATDPGSPWADDCIEFAFCPIDQPRDADRAYGQCFVIKDPAFLSPPLPIIPSRYLGNPASWQAFCEAPYGAAGFSTNPPEARNFPIWTSDTGVDWYTEYNIAVWDHAEADGPASSPRTILEAGMFLPSNLWFEDGDGPWVSDITVRSNEAAAVQYFATSILLGMNDYTSPTAVQETTWGRVKNTF